MQASLNVQALCNLKVLGARAEGGLARLDMKDAYEALKVGRNLKIYRAA